MKRFILTGAPGSGKTTLLHYLRDMGYSIVEEAATDIIAIEQQNGVPEPWTYPSFIDKILSLQKQRQIQAMPSPAETQFFDRSPLDTYALCKYLGFPISPQLFEEVKEAQESGRYEREIFFIENLGFCEPSAARKITYEESLRFEKIHEETFTEWGYLCVKVPPLPVPERAMIILTRLSTL